MDRVSLTWLVDSGASFWLVEHPFFLYHLPIGFFLSSLRCLLNSLLSRAGFSKLVLVTPTTYCVSFWRCGICWAFDIPIMLSFGSGARAAPALNQAYYFHLHNVLLKRIDHTSICPRYACCCFSSS